MPAESPSSVAIPLPLQEAVSRVISLTNSVRHRASASADNGYSHALRAQLPAGPRLWEYAPDFLYNVISILGGRGAGKTTALQYSIERLVGEGRDIVLSPIQPERFRDQDSLLGWVFANVEEYVRWCDEQLQPAAGHTEREQPAASRLLGEKFHRLQRNIVATYGRYNEALVQAHPDRYEYGAEMARLNSDGFLLQREIHRFFWELLNTFGRLRPDASSTALRAPLLIIPVDDADMEIRMVAPILRQMRFLVAHERVVIIAAGDLETFRQALRADLMKNGIQMTENPGLRPSASMTEFTSRHVEAQLTKYLPLNLRILLPEMSIRERLRFAPPNEDRTLLDLLNQVKLHDASTAAPETVLTLGQYFELSWAFRNSDDAAIGQENFIPSSHCDCLSGVPRNLMQLYRALRDAVDTPTRRRNRKRWVAETLQTFWRHLVAGAPIYEQPELADLVQWEITQDACQVATDFSAFHDGVQTGTGCLVRSADRCELFFRKLRIFNVNRRDPEHPEPVDRTRARDDLNRHTQASVIFATEFVGGSIGLEAGTFRHLAGPGGGNVIVVRPFINREEVELSLWGTPDWDAYIDHILFYEQWNRLMDLMLQAPPYLLRSEEYGATLIEQAALVHLETIVSIQRKRSLTALPKTFAELEAHLKVWRSRRETRLGKIRSELLAALPREISRNSRLGDLVNWACVSLPLMALPEVSTDWMQQKLLALWHECAMQTGRVGNRDFVEEAARMVVGRANNHLGDTIVDNLIVLLERMGQSAKAEELKRRAGEYTFRNRTEQLAKAIEYYGQRGVPRQPLEELRLTGPNEFVRLGLLQGGLSETEIESLFSLALEGSTGESKEKYSRGDGSLNKRNPKETL